MGWGQLVSKLLGLGATIIYLYYDKIVKLPIDMPTHFDFFLRKNYLPQFTFQTRKDAIECV